MYISKIILTLLTVGALVLVPTVASAQTEYTFLEDDGDWQTETHWDPEGRPGAADTVIIPNGKTCRIETANQAADLVDIQSGGTLQIKSRTLTISSDSFLCVNGTGTLQFKDTGTDAKLLYKGFLNIDGNGTIDAEGPTYGPGHIENAPKESGSLYIGSHNGTEDDPTFRGSILLDIDGDLWNQGEFKVVNSADTMEIGPVNSGSSRGSIRGTGKFTAPGGTLKIGRMTMVVGANPWSGTIAADSGTFHLTEYITWQLGLGNVTLDNGGTILIDTPWISQGGFRFTNGTLIAGAAAVFSGDSP